MLEQILMLGVVLLVAAALVGLIVLACQKFQVPLYGLWVVAAVVVTALLYLLIRLAEGNLRLPVGS